MLDRVIQQATAQVLGALFEGGFSEHSYGFREGRSAHQAVGQVEAGWKEGRRHAADCDLKSFFDTVNHDRLMGECSFLGFQIGVRGKVAWTAKALARFKERVREITRRNRGHRAQDVVDELRLYVTGWLNYFGISHTYKVVLELGDWVRRRVRLYYWKQWKQPRTRRRHLIALGINLEEVKLATRSRKGYWRMSFNRIVQQALSNGWLEDQGVPDMRTLWIKLHYGPKARV